MVLHLASCLQADEMPVALTSREQAGNLGGPHKELIQLLGHAGGCFPFP